jgi:hypothetical protein
MTRGEFWLLSVADSRQPTANSDKQWQIPTKSGNSWRQIPKKSIVGFLENIVYS